jgi:dTDP-4-amino-4,6-dideoxygalactose transaminase
MNEKFPVAEKLARQGFYIPGGAGIEQHDMETVTASIADFFLSNG